MKMKAKTKRNLKRARALLILVSLIAVLTAMSKANEPKLVGYTYDSGNTLWGMAEKYCPSEMDIRDFIREIEELNGVQNSIVYKNQTYKIPVYETKSEILEENEYLNMNTVIGYEASDDGVMLLTNDGCGYFVE